MTYSEFRKLVKAELEENPDGKTWKQLREALSLPYRTPCPEWVKKLETEIGLDRTQKRGKSLIWKLDRWANPHVNETLCTVTPTLCALLGAEAPSFTSGAISRKVIQEAERVLGKALVQRCLVFAPDAMGSHLRTINPGIYQPVMTLAPLELSLRAVLPPKTPVCFASMFTGLIPDMHGIRSYEKPVLACETLFDTLAPAGLRMAIVAVEDSSIDLIFRGRQVDYFTEEYDQQVVIRVLSLLEKGSHDFILAYCQEYDDALHRTDPYSSEALKAAEHHISDFARLSEAVDLYWGSFNRILLFAPDHGAHIDAQKGNGTHGDDIPEDMEVSHFWGFRKGMKVENDDTQ